MAAGGPLSESSLLGLPHALIPSQPDAQRERDIQKLQGAESCQAERIGASDGTMTGLGRHLASMKVTEPRGSLVPAASHHWTRKADSNSSPVSASDTLRRLCVLPSSDSGHKASKAAAEVAGVLYFLMSGNRA